MNILLDANILLRLAEPGHQQYQQAYDAVRVLRSQGHSLCVVPQDFYEFWTVCTRPVALNGLGKSRVEAANEIAKIRAAFHLFPDTPAILPKWEQLVITYSVIGKLAHDARVVAAMIAHGVTHLLTFNEQDFLRFPMITVLTPAAVLTNSTLVP